MSTHLVTGGAGFIASHLVDALLAEGHEVVVLDDLSGGKAERVPPAAKLVIGSITDHKVVDEVFASWQFCGVFHLAAFAAEGISHAVKTVNYTSNILGSVNVINAALRARAGFIGFASSVAVYGHGTVPMREVDVPAPADSYGNAKLTVERELAITMHMQRLPYFAVRMHNVYGEHQNMSDPYRNAVAIFLNQIMRGEPITVYGKGDQVRAFTYVRDIVRAFITAGERSVWGEALNVGSTTPTTILELAHLVRDAMGVPDHPITHLPARDEVKVAYTDSSRARTLLGDWPETPLSVGIARTATWARSQGPCELASCLTLEVPYGGDEDSWVDWISRRLEGATRV